MPFPVILASVCLVVAIVILHNVATWLFREAAALYDQTAMPIMSAVIAWIFTNPFKGLWRIFNAILFFFPNVTMNLLLSLLGWGAAGPMGGFCTLSHATILT
jgi:hypothetical protein